MISPSFPCWENMSLAVHEYAYIRLLHQQNKRRERSRRSVRNVKGYVLIAFLFSYFYIYDFFFSFFFASFLLHCVLFLLSNFLPSVFPYLWSPAVSLLCLTLILFSQDGSLDVQFCFPAPFTWCACLRNPSLFFSSFISYWCLWIFTVLLVGTACNAHTVHFTSSISKLWNFNAVVMESHYEEHTSFYGN